MPLFSLQSGKLIQARLSAFRREKELQSLIEKNLETVFNCRFVETEFPTGERHGGRIDTLALSEENNPVIIEYKKVESSDLINQSLFYLSWMADHRGDFQLLVNKTLGSKTEVDWSEIRVICMAPGYKKYDLHAVEMMGANIELWQYRLYDNGVLHLEEVFRRRGELAATSGTGSKNLVMVAAGKKAAITRATASYTIDQHLSGVPEATLRLVEAVRDYINGLGDDVEETPKKFYIAYKVAHNFVCLEIRKKKILLFLKLDPSTIKPMPENGRDVRKIGHYGTGDFELTIETEEQLEEAYKFIHSAYEIVGG